MTNAVFDEADLSADEKNQSMDLMRGAFKSAKLDGSSFRGANMARVIMEFASLRRADLSNATLRKGEFAGADFTNANVAGTNFEGADLNAARIADALIIAKLLERLLKQSSRCLQLILGFKAGYGANAPNQHNVTIL